MKAPAVGPYASPDALNVRDHLRFTISAAEKENCAMGTTIVSYLTTASSSTPTPPPVATAEPSGPLALLEVEIDDLHTRPIGLNKSRTEPNGTTAFFVGLLLSGLLL